MYRKIILAVIGPSYDVFQMPKSSGFYFKFLRTFIAINIIYFTVLFVPITRSVYKVLIGLTDINCHH